MLLGLDCSKASRLGCPAFFRGEVRRNQPQGPQSMQGAPGGYPGAQQPQQQMGAMGTFSPPQFKQTSPGGQNQQQGAGGSPSLL